jgi:hypothetical protein
MQGEEDEYEDEDWFTMLICNYILQFAIHNY